MAHPAVIHVGYGRNAVEFFLPTHNMEQPGNEHVLLGSTSRKRLQIWALNKDEETEFEGKNRIVCESAAC
jgi:hypothetical protein